MMKPVKKPAAANQSLRIEDDPNVKSLDARLIELERERIRAGERVLTAEKSEAGPGLCRKRDGNCTTTL